MQQQQHKAAQAAGMSDVQEQLAQTKEELTKKATAALRVCVPTARALRTTLGWSFKCDGQPRHHHCWNGLPGKIKTTDWVKRCDSLGNDEKTGVDRGCVGRTGWAAQFHWTARLWHEGHGGMCEIKASAPAGRRAGPDRSGTHVGGGPVLNP